MNVKDHAMKNIEAFITSTMYLSTQLRLTPEEFTAATLLMNKINSKRMGMSIQELTAHQLDFLERNACLTSDSCI